MRRLLHSIAHYDGFWLEDTATVSETIACMFQNGHGTVVLLHDKHPVAIVTESLLIERLGEGIDFGLPILPLAHKTLITILSHRPIESAFDLMVTNNIRRLIMVEPHGEFSGVILQEDLFAFLEEDVYKIDLKVSDILLPNPEVITVGTKASLHEVLRVMHTRRIGSVIVSDDNIKPLGIITEKDILKAGHNRISLSQNVQSLMSYPIKSVTIDAPIPEVISLMRDHNIRRVLVTNTHYQIFGLLTNRDIFQYIKGNVTRMLEMKLRHAKEIMNLLPEAIIEIVDTSSEQTVQWMNDTAKRLFGSQLINRSLNYLMGDDQWEQLYNTLGSQGTVHGVVVLIQEKSFEFSGTLSQNINNRYIKLIVKDITEHEIIKQQLKQEVQEESRLRRENEYILMQQSRMASMGEMVGHIAHQWRQPLAQLGGIFMNLEAAYSFGELDENYLTQKIEQANKMITYMSQTIDDFRLFFSPERTAERFDIMLSIKRAIDIVRASLDYHHIELTLQGKENTFWVMGYPNEFAQAVLNLLNNSRDALSQTHQTHKYIQITLDAHKDHIVLKLCDNGGGIEPSLLSKLFEPFVTTKESSQGTGIGLYITRFIIEQKMEGKIEAYNVNQGSCFQIRLVQH